MRKMLLYYLYFQEGISHMQWETPFTTLAGTEKWDSGLKKKKIRQTWNALRPLGAVKQVTECWSTKSKACNAQDPKTNFSLWDKKKKKESSKQQQKLCAQI